MGLDDYNLFIFKYKNYNFSNINEIYKYLIYCIKQDFIQIKFYYINIFNWKKWEDDKVLLIFILFFYLFLILIDKFQIFIIYKIIFYIIKYLIKYIFIIIDLILYIILRYLKIENKIIYIFLKILYSISFKLLYKFYNIIFNIIPFLIHYKYLIVFLGNITLIFLETLIKMVKVIPYNKIKNIIIKLYRNIYRFLIILLAVYSYRSYILDLIKKIIYNKFFFLNEP